MPDSKKEIIGGAAEYNYVKKDVSWYWVMGGLVATLIMIAIWQKNLFFALFIAIAGTILLFFGKRRPQIYNFRISDDGVCVGDKIFYSYDRFVSFAIHNRPSRLDEVILRRKTAVNPYVKIPIDSKLALQAKVILKNKLPEVEYQESILDIISDWLGF